MHIVIDLMGDSDDVIDMGPEEDPKVVAEREEKKRKFLEEIYRRQTQLQIVPIEHTKS